VSTISGIIADIRMWCGEPTNEHLGLGTILRVLHDEQTTLNNDLSLGEQNQLLQKQYLGTPAQDFLISAGSFNSLVSVEIQVSEADDRWSDVPIVDKTSINDEQLKGNRVAALYGTPPRITLSWNPADQADLPVRIWYETTPPVPDITGSSTINSAYHPLLSTRSAKNIREIILGLPPNPALDRKLAIHERQWEQFANKSSDQRPFMRGVSYGLDRHRRGY
jgi:hypothetical protein